MCKARLSVKEAAALMNATEQFVRRGIQLGVFGFAYAVKEDGRQRATYWISAKKFTEETGIRIESEEDHEQKDYEQREIPADENGEIIGK